MKSLKSAVFLIVILALFTAVPALAKAPTIKINDKVFFENFPVVVECETDVVGEKILLTGYMHLTLQATYEGLDIVHYKANTNPMGLVGTGTETGEIYQGTGVTVDKFTAKAGKEFSFINNQMFISHGSSINFTTHETIHVTFNANGDLTANVEILKGTCQDRD